MGSGELRWKADQAQQQGGLIAQQASVSVRQRVEVSYPSCIVVLDGIRDAVLALRHGRRSNNKEEPSAGEYFLAIATALNDATGASSMTDDLRKQLLELLFVTTSASNSTIVLVEGAMVLQCLRKMLSDMDYGEGNPEMDVRVLKCMGSILSCHKEGKGAWNSSYVVRALISILGRAGDPDPQVRKAAHYAVREVLMSTYYGTEALQIPQKILTKFCTEMLSQIEKKDPVKAKYLLKLISEVGSWIGGSRVSVLCESCSSLASLGSPSISADLMRCISGLVQLLGSCLVRAMQLDQATAREKFPLVVSSLAELCEAPAAPVVHKAAAENMNLAFQTVVDQEIISTLISTKPFDFMASPLDRALFTIQGLMQHKYQLSWPYALPIVGRLFLHLKEASYPILARTLEELSRLQTKLLDAPSSAAPAGSQAAIKEALGYAIEGIGIERTLMILPLRPVGTPDSTGVPSDRAWLLPLLRKHGGGSKCSPSSCQLSYFLKGILPIARHCDALCQGRDGLTSLSANEGKTQSFRVVQLWQLFPCFCASPSDIASSLWDDLTPVIASELQGTRYPDIIPAICHGLQLLVDCSKKKREQRATAPLKAETTVTEDKEHHQTTTTVQNAAMTVMGSVSTKLLPLLFSLLEKNASSSLENTEMRVNTPTQVLGTVSALVSVAPTPFVTNLFKKLLHKLLEKRAAGLSSTSAPPPLATPTTTEASASPITSSPGETRLATAATTTTTTTTTAPLKLACTYLDLIACMMPQLEPDCVRLCYRAIKPMIQDDQIPGIQKRAYKALLALCHHHSQFIVSDPSDLQVFVDLLVGSPLYNCHAKARRARLKCLLYMVQNFQPENEEHKAATRAIISEIILCMKDTNARTRETASELLVTLGNADAVGLMKLVAAGLGGLSPHMRSGALAALMVLNKTYAHYKSQFHKDSVAAMTPDVMSTVLVLLVEPYKEVVQAALEFLKVASGGLDRQRLEPLIGPICNAMFPENGMTNVNKCIAEVKGVLRKLTRKCGFNAVRAIMPESHCKIITAMQKLSEKELRTKKKLNSSATVAGNEGGGSTGRGARWSAADYLPSSVLIQEGRKRKLSGNTNDGGDSDDEYIIDLLDENNMMLKHRSLPGGRIAHNDSTTRYGFDTDSSDDDSNGGGYHSGSTNIQLDTGGRLIIPQEDDDDSEDKPDSRKAEENATGSSSLTAERREEQGDCRLKKRHRGNASLSADKGQRVEKRIKIPHTKLPGSEYKSTKGGGDVQRKDQALEPHAYIPLDASKLVSYLKHKKGHDVAQVYGAVVKGRRGKKGYQPRSRRPKKGHK